LVTKVILAHGFLPPRKIARMFPGTPWIFFDQGYLERIKWEKVLGADLKVGYKELLDEVSYALRDEFIEWSVRLGKRHWNKWYWWISRLATRNNMNSKLYLYSCYAEVFKRILDERSGSLIVISNSWELLDVIERYAREKVTVLSACVLRSAAGKVYSYSQEIITFLLAWVYFFMKNIYELCACRFSRLKGHPKKDQVYDKNHIVIHTCVDDSCIGVDGKFRDRYFPGLADYLRGKGKKVSTLVWLYNVRRINLFSIFRWFRENKESFLIPQDYYNFFDCVYAFLVILKASILRFSREEAYFKDIDLSPLLCYEQVLQARDIGSASFINRIKLFGKWRSLGYKLKTYVDMWELKNCEVEATIGVRKYYPDAKTLGFQHSALVPRLLFGNYKTTLEEFRASPHPDFGLVNSAIVNEFLIGEGFPDSFLRLGPALRYSWLKKPPVSEGKPENKEGILICLSLSYDISSEILEMFYMAFKDNPEYKIWVKFHPMMVQERLMKRLSFDLPPNFALVEGAIENWIKRAKVVITSQSSAMVDAVSMGIKTIVIARQTDIDIIPLDISGNNTIWQIVRNPKELADAVGGFFSYPGVNLDSARNFFEFRMELLDEVFN